ncbi:MAG: hypothetical protein FD175_1838 [Beijerinckiaceae bacterium]|nr:MAG: hypothetical protein FD175_1838 [Beijerinckiaceae bacterium]
MSNRMITSGKPSGRGEKRPLRKMSSRKARTRLVVLAAGLLASLGFAVVAASQGRPDLIAARLGIPNLTADGKTTAELTTMAGFQRRGNSLVGEVKTRDGAVMRLVFDARTHTLIGLRVLDPAENPSEKAASARACPDESTTAPLPYGVSPAN